MTQNIITAGAANNGLAFASGDDGSLVLQTGPSGAKVNALSIDAAGNTAVLGSLTVTGRTVQQTMHLQHRAASGGSGGSMSAGVWTQGPLNTVVTNTIVGASLSSNQFTLPAGVYKIWADRDIYAGASVKCHLKNVTDSITTLFGSSGYSNQSNITSIKSTVKGVLTLAATKTFQIEHWAAGTGGGASQLGAGVNSGETELFADVFITRE